MIVIPAIDLKDGHCVRLFQGDMSKDTVYSDDPGAMAKKWQDLGAERLHMVDLNGAFAGEPVNADAIRAILEAVSIPVQLGGGLRNMETLEACFKIGLQTAILGTVAYRDPKFVGEACRAFPGHISVGIDARGGMVAVEGWAEATNIDALTLAQQFEDVGVAEVIFTDISRDGAMTGPNYDATRELAETISIPVILSGGISSLEDVKQAAANAGPFTNGNRISGAITGRALYDGSLDFSEAVRVTQEMAG
ncbi:MAG: 1-(5-phosphoribosyl)-5-[(5-phosphoribosylamino)methylideneamino]imidazole-4-carboxamide isomerase [Magnetococcales bacterium]|nr:1-(5-phosphoribosyl)-5-[(5-phosphoribosylamino)methylideneamino]imidazole-4-carboxamide isomerase [Magnetococcales bacterium]